MNRGRPRKIRDEQTTFEPVEEKTKEVINIVEHEKKVDKKYIVPQLGKGKMEIIPYNSLEKLNVGDKRFFINGNTATGYKLIKVYKIQDSRTGKNGESKEVIKRSLVCTLKPRKRTARGSTDREILNRLKNIGVPGIL